MADYATLLRDYVTLTCRSVDRIFLQAYVPKLQCVGGVCQSLVTLDYTSATGLLEVTSQVTAVTAPASRLRPIDVSHVHPGGQSSVSSSVGPLQVPARDQPGQGLLAVQVGTIHLFFTGPDDQDPDVTFEAGRHDEDADVTAALCQALG